MSENNETNMMQETALVDFLFFNEPDFYQYRMYAPVAIAPYFARFYIDEYEQVRPLEENMMPDTVMIILN